MNNIYEKFLKIYAPRVWSLDGIGDLHKYVIAANGDPVSFEELLFKMPKDSVGHSPHEWDLESSISSSISKGDIIPVNLFGGNEYLAIKLAPHAKNICRSYMKHWGSIPEL